MIRKWITQFIRHIDSILLATVLMVLVMALMVLYSASGQSFAKVNAQLINILVMMGVMLLAANTQPQHIERIALPAYLFGLILLIAVALIGDISHGARRWLNLGVTKIQPSELMKLAAPIMLAWYFSKREGLLRSTDYLIAGAILMFPVLLIAKQPDLGTATLVFASGFYVIFLAGLSWKFIFGSAIAFGAALPVLWSMLHDYQRRRVEILIDPSQDPLGAGYHIIQATIAIGSGGATGKGWLNGTQSQLDFVPERTTDFIFAVFAEEFGMVGCCLLLLLFTIIIGRAFYIASQAKSVFSRLLAGSIAATFFTYCFVNMGMVSGILPVVGIPLPLVSYGGTSLLTLGLSLGLLMSVQSHKRLVASD
ncbi:MAG TPA: rod shape-determining protein RodA [Methylophilus sp.]